MNQLNEILANNLTFLRKKHNYTQLDIANKMQYSDKTVSKWETGEIIPNVENLIKLCEIYNVTLDQITKPLIEETPKIEKKDFSRQNKLIISLLSILVVWIVATNAFVYGQILTGESYWMVFIWAVPISCIVTIVFNKLWGWRTFGFIIISILIWSLITCFYLQFLSYNLFAIYFIGIPLQIAVILWSGLKKTKQKENF